MQPGEEQPLKLTERDRKRLAAYFDILIEMHLEYKRNHKGDGNEDDPLLQLVADGQSAIEAPDNAG